MIEVDTTGMDISNAEEVYYRRLFEQLLKFFKGPEPLKGNVVIPFNGQGLYGQLRIEKFVDLNGHR
jgi:hypothetical protein